MARKPSDAEADPFWISGLYLHPICAARTEQPVDLELVTLFLMTVKGGGGCGAVG